MTGGSTGDGFTEAWFAVAAIGDGVHLISEPGHVNCFLVVGTERALLFDTGLGLGDIGSVVAGITDLPVVAVNSHAHLDHRGGNRHFDRVLAHPAAVPGLATSYGPRDIAWLESYAGRMLAAHEETRLADETFFHHRDRLLTPRPLPMEQLAGYHVPGSVPTGLLEDGDEIDLGGRALRVIHCPGHSPDSVVLVEDATGIVLAGDVLVAGVSYAHLPGAEPAAFARSVARLAELTPGRRRILLAHTMRYELDGTFLDEAVEGWRRIAGGAAGSWRAWTDMFDVGCWRTDLRRFSVTLSTPGMDAPPG
ncbi:MBL fold metallo-hydrolase [Nocardioides sp. L-11A]|uniref:MBL fold metallo-hydrolase n=1 Tax=Nocardioides sp. L-11A TaxID=3043848 RepID=UPI00249B2669|nr:MBL fold metallo-hydrolase [Nocardioides sp. L-11A]